MSCGLVRVTNGFINHPIDFIPISIANRVLGGYPALMLVAPYGELKKQISIDAWLDLFMEPRCKHTLAIFLLEQHLTCTPAYETMIQYLTTDMNPKVFKIHLVNLIIQINYHIARSTGSIIPDQRETRKHGPDALHPICH